MPPLPNASSQQKCCTIPLWFGCAVLCTILVALVGFSPFLAGQHNSDVIVAQARNTYNMVFEINGESLYYKYVNEAITPILAYYQAYNKPQLMVNMNFTDPMWDREWQLFFTGVSATNPERYFYYMDLATGTFTGQYVRGSEKLRIVGHASDVNFTGYVPNRTPPFGYTQASANVTLEFPPLLMFNDLFASGQPTFTIQHALSTSNEFVYGVATYITGASFVPVGALLEIIPLSEIARAIFFSGVSVVEDSQSFMFDNRGALTGSSLPALSNIELPVGTPGAICITVAYNGRNISKCQHSRETVIELYPILKVAYEAVTTRPEGTVDGSITSVSYVTFPFEGSEYLVSASFPILMSNSWWNAAITPIGPVYGRYISSRQKILLIVASVTVGMALFVLLLTYLLMLPLGKLMAKMIAALKLQTQADRHVNAANTKRQQLPSNVASSVILGREIHVSELRSIELAIVRLHELLEDVARMLPPAVIQAIRRTLVQPRSDSPDAADSGMTTDGLLDSEDQSDAESSSFNSRAKRTSEHLSARQTTGHDVEQMMSWFEQNYHLQDAGADALKEAPQAEGVVVQQRPMDSTVLAVSSSVEVGPPLVADDNCGILMNPSVSLRPARRRGYFMAVSLAQLTREPSHLAEAIAPLLSLVWHHRGEVELIERGLILVSFGCYDALDGAPDCAMACGIAIADTVSASSSTGRCFVTIDCGWFETLSFSCMLPSGTSVLRRQVVSSVARDAVVKLLPLAEVLNERLLISGDALRHVDPEALRGRVPMIVDYLRFDARRGSRATRRSMMFLFSVPPAQHIGPRRGATDSMTTAQPFILTEFRKNDARRVAESFRLMVNGQYREAEAYLRRNLTTLPNSNTAQHRNRTETRLLAISRMISDAQMCSPHAMAPYFRGECSLFEASLDELKLAERSNATHPPIAAATVQFGPTFDGGEGTRPGRVRARTGATERRRRSLY